MNDDDDHFFRLLYTSDYELEGEDDHGQAYQALNRFFGSLAGNKTSVHKQSEADKPSRAQFTSLRRVSSVANTMSEPISSPHQFFIPPALKSYSSAPVCSSESMTKPRAKRQKMTTLPLVPEQLQFFRGQNFCKCL
jgi:hypothetical protein